MKMFDPFRSPIIRTSWYDRIERGEEKPFCRVWGQKLHGRCYIWLGWNNQKPGGAYGIVKVEGVRWYLHRYVYSKFYGIELTPADCVDHLCRNRLCFNPYHTECTDHHTNYERGDGKNYQFKPADDGLSDEDVEGLLG